MFGDTCFLNEITDSDTLEYLQLEKQNHLEMAIEDDTAVTQLDAVPTQGLAVNLPSVRDPKYLDHRRVCHIGKQLYDRTVAAVDGLPKVTHNPNCPCCVMAKSTKKRRSRNAWREHKSGPMQKLHMDLMGKFKHASLGGAYYALVIVDDHSRYTEVYTLQRKNEAIHRFKEFIATHYPPDQYPKAIMTDWGTEFQGAFEDFCVEKHISMEKSCPYSAWQNGLVERANRTLSNIARAMMLEEQRIDGTHQNYETSRLNFENQN